MEKRTLGKTDLEVSVLGFGGAPIGFLETAQQQVAEVLHRLRDHGVNLIDTAAIYPGSEEAIGKAIEGTRDQWIVVSKCGQAFEDLEGPAWSATVIEQTVERSLRRLRTDYLDVMLLHSCDLQELQRGEALEALVKARNAGKVRHVGYSGDNEAAVYAAELEDVAVIETSINICDQSSLETLLPVADENYVGILAKRPLANAAWKDLQQQPGFYREYAQTYTQRQQALEITPSDVGLRGDPSITWPELALRFTLSHDSVTAAVVGTTNPEHVAKNVAAAAKGPLPEKAIARIQKAYRRAEAAADRPWEGQT